MAPIAKAHNCSPARIALAYVLAKPFVTSIIIGAKRLDQLEDNIAAVDLKLHARRTEATRRGKRSPARIPRLDASLPKRQPHRTSGPNRPAHIRHKITRVPHVRDGLIVANVGLFSKTRTTFLA